MDYWARKEDVLDLIDLYNHQTQPEKIYDRFAQDWTNKRSSPWKAFQNVVTPFLNTHFPILADLGSGSGRNQPLFEPSCSHLVHLDLALDLLSECRNRDPHLQTDSISSQGSLIHFVQGDLCRLPFRNNVLDCCAEVASLHHIQTEAQRRRCLQEACRVLTRKGMLIVTLWRFDQPKFKEWYEWQKEYFARLGQGEERPISIKGYSMEFGDVIVPWTNSTSGVTHYRFYHLFTRETVDALFKGLEPTAIKMFDEKQQNNFLVVVNLKSRFT